MNKITTANYARKLMRYGVLLFLLGLVTGFMLPLMRNPRMGLSSHLEGVMNGMFLLLLGLIWHHLRLSNRALSWAYHLVIFAAFTNWVTTLLAGVWGAGAGMMSIAGGNYTGLVWQEGLIKVALLSLSVAMLVVCGLLLWGLRGLACEVKTDSSLV